jgi:hypothetical protein
MMKVQILGTGCAKCRALTANAEKAIGELGIDARSRRWRRSPTSPAWV